MRPPPQWIGECVYVPAAAFLPLDKRCSGDASPHTTSPTSEIRVAAVVVDVAPLVGAVQVVRVDDFRRFGLLAAPEAFVPVERVQALREHLELHHVDGDCPCLPPPQQDAASLNMPAWMHHHSHHSLRWKDGDPQHRQCPIAEYDHEGSCCCLTELRYTRQQARVAGKRGMLTTTTARHQPTSGVTPLATHDDRNVYGSLPSLMPRELVQYATNMAGNMFGNSSGVLINPAAGASKVRGISSSNASAPTCKVTVVPLTALPPQQDDGNARRTSSSPFVATSGRWSLSRLSQPTWSRAMIFEMAWRLSHLNDIAACHHHKAVGGSPSNQFNSRSCAVTQNVSVNGERVKKLLFVIDESRSGGSGDCSCIGEELAAMLQYMVTVIGSQQEQQQQQREGQPAAPLCQQPSSAAPAMFFQSWEAADTSIADADWIICPWTSATSALLTPSNATPPAAPGGTSATRNEPENSSSDLALLLREIRASTTPNTTTSSRKQRSSDNQDGDDDDDVGTDNKHGDLLRRFIGAFHVVCWVDPRPASSDTTTLPSFANSSSDVQLPVLDPERATLTVDDVMNVWIEDKLERVRASAGAGASGKKPRSVSRSSPTPKKASSRHSLRSTALNLFAHKTSRSSYCFARVTFVYTAQSDSGADIRGGRAPQGDDHVSVVCAASRGALFQAASLLSSSTNEPTLTTLLSIKRPRSQSTEAVKQEDDDATYSEVLRPNRALFTTTSQQQHISGSSSSSRQRRRLSLERDGADLSPPAEPPLSISRGSVHLRPSFGVSRTAGIIAGGSMPLEYLKQRWTDIALNDLFIASAAPHQAGGTVTSELSSPQRIGPSHLTRLFVELSQDLAETRTYPPLRPRLLVVRVVPWNTCMTTSTIDAPRRMERRRQEALQLELLGAKEQQRGDDSIVGALFMPRVPMYDAPTVVAAAAGAAGGAHSELTASSEWQCDAALMKLWAARNDGGVLFLTVPDRVAAPVEHRRSSASASPPSANDKRGTTLRRRSLYDPAEEAAELALVTRALTAALHAEGVIVVDDAPRHDTWSEKGTGGSGELDVASSTRLTGRWATTHLLPLLAFRQQLCSSLGQRSPRLITVSSELAVNFLNTTCELPRVHELLWDLVRRTSFHQTAEHSAAVTLTTAVLPSRSANFVKKEEGCSDDDDVGAS